MDSPTIKNLKSSAAAVKDKIPGILEAISLASANAINELKTVLDPQSLQKAIQLLERARFIHVIGEGDAFPVVALLETGLSVQGYVCQIHGASGDGSKNNGMSLSGPSDLLIVVNAYGNEWPLALAEDARSRKIPVVAITDSPVSPYVDSSDIRLIVPQASVFGTHLLAGHMAVAQMLMIALEHYRAANN